MINLRYCVFNLFEEHTYVAWLEPGRCVIVDPGCREGAELQALLDLLEQESLTPEAILLTHGHIDHILGVKALQDRFGIPVYLHPADTAALEYNEKMAQRFRMKLPGDFRWTPMQDGQMLELAGMRFEVITTPGHTPGCVCYLEREQGVLFTGDTLFAGSIGRTDFPGGDMAAMGRSLRRLRALPPSLRVLAGHGPDTDIATELRHNPFLQD